MCSFCLEDMHFEIFKFMEEPTKITVSMVMPKIMSLLYIHRISFLDSQTHFQTKLSQSRLT